MVGTFAKMACTRPSHRSKHQYLLMENAGGKRNNPSAHALHGVPLLERFEAVEHPAEPSEKDKPVGCPPPQNNILQDGLMWRERVASSLQRQMEIRSLGAWQEGDALYRSEYISNNPVHGNANEKHLLVTHSAPAEFALSRN